MSRDEYEERLEAKTVEIILRIADQKWPSKKELNEKLIVPWLGAADPYRTARILRGEGKNLKPRRLKLAELIRACTILDIKPHRLLNDAEYELDIDLTEKPKKSEV